MKDGKNCEIIFKAKKEVFLNDEKEKTNNCDYKQSGV